MRYRPFWQAANTLLADTAINLLSKLQRQQTYFLADYLQIFLNKCQTVTFSKASLLSIASTLQGLQNLLPPISQEKHAHNNQALVTCFALQLMLRETLAQPLQQTQEFHRAPHYNADLPNRPQLKQLHVESTMHLELVQCLMKWLQHWHNGTAASLASLIDGLHDPESANKIPPVDDVEFLNISQLKVCPA